MTIRTKVWLLVALSVASSVAAASWIRASFTEAKLLGHALSSARDLAHDIVADVSERPQADAEKVPPSPERQKRRRQAQAYLGEAGGKTPRRLMPRTDPAPLAPLSLDQALLQDQLGEFLQHHPSLLWLELELVDEQGRPDRRIFASPHYGPDVSKLSGAASLPLTSAEEVRESEIIIQRPVRVQGQWQGRLRMAWTLKAVRTAVGLAERSSLVFVAVLLVLLSSIAVLITDRLVVRRLRALENAMREVESGNLKLRVPERPRDEIGSLSAGFNHMVGRLTVADEEIRQFHARLQDEVHAATRDLQDKNAALEQMNRLLHDLRHENATKVRLAGLGQLAAQLAHEVGTPLSSISGHLQLALQDMDMPEVLRQRLEVVSREVLRIGQIFRSYLDSTRNLKPDLQMTDWRRVLREACEVVRTSAPQRALEVKMELDGPPPFILTDPGLLRQVLINLLTNACDAMDGQGAILLQAHHEAGRLRLLVQDSGPGIASESLGRIFEPFYTTKTSGKGTGLGLAISRQLVNSLAGELTVESLPGQGAKFSVWLPLTQVNVAPLRREAFV